MIFLCVPKSIFSPFSKGKIRVAGDPLVVCAEPKPLPFSSNTRMYPSLLDQFTSPKKIPVNSGTNGNTVSTDTVSVSR